MLHFFVILVFIAAASGSRLDSRVVNTEQGPVRGYNDPDGGLFGFYNIPYAKAPTGRHRFKAPLAPTVRAGIFEAVDKAIICPQIDFITNTLQRDVIVTEDCLIANILVPATHKTNLPVFIDVHGGGFMLGYGNLITFKNFAKSKEVIVVSFNYRLGPHGFLCLGTDDVPGNAGMKDQVALLHWVQNNIKNFGGNPDDVTISGCSAGSGSVELLTLSNTTNGLFSKAILQSGASTSFWSVQTDPLQVAKKYARKLNFTNTDDLYALEEFYKSISYEILISEQDLHSSDATFMFSPCVERDTEGEEFLTDSPVNILKRGNYKKIPMLYGFAEMEGLIREQHFQEWKDRMNDDFSEFIPHNLNFASNDEKRRVANEIKTFYFGDDPISEKNILSYIDYFSDEIIAYGQLRSIKFHLEAGHDGIYLYVYSFVHDDDPIVSHTNIRGATHCAQTFCIADGNLTHANDAELLQEYKDVKKVMKDLWFNFVKTGKPVADEAIMPAWPPVSKDWSPHMIIDKTLTLGGSLLKERTQFWDKIHDKYYGHPLPPPTPPPRHIEL